MLCVLILTNMFKCLGPVQVRRSKYSLLLLSQVSSECSYMEAVTLTGSPYVRKCHRVCTTTACSCTNQMAMVLVYTVHAYSLPASISNNQSVQQSILFFSYGCMRQQRSAGGVPPPSIPTGQTPLQVWHQRSNGSDVSFL